MRVVALICWLFAACARPDRPNVVLILADDLDSPSMAALPGLRTALADAGLSFRQSFVSVSLCSPSRASALRGQYAHSTGVLGNAQYVPGGHSGFRDLGLEQDTVAVWMHEAGYHTALVGKYLNGYPEEDEERRIPAGWDDWVVPARGNPYEGYDYTLNVNGRLVEHGSAPDDYVTDMLAEHARRVVRARAPFFLVVAPFTPHDPAPVPVRYQDELADLRAPRDPSWNEVDVSDKPAWLQAFAPMNDEGVAYTDAVYRDRLRSTLAIGDLVDAVIAELDAQGLLDETYVFFTSDNGYHLGQHRLWPGKNTAYDPDLRVPLYVRGPGIEPGGANDAIVANIDLAPTFADLAGAEVPDWVEGRSLVPLLRGESPDDWREALLLEHVGPEELQEVGTSDELPPSWGFMQSTNGTFYTPDFVGVRTQRHTYVVYADGSEELYDDLADPWQLENLAERADPELLDALHAATFELALCRGPSCREAERLDLEPTLPELHPDAPISSSP